MDVRRIFKDYFHKDELENCPTVLECGYEKYGDFLLLYEESKGEAFFNNELYDLTFLRLDTQSVSVQRIDLDKSFTSEKELYEYFTAIDLEMFEEADVFGEVMKLDGG